MFTSIDYKKKISLKKWYKELIDETRHGTQVRYNHNPVQ